MKNLIAAALLLFMATTTIDAQVVNRFRDSTVFYNSVRTQGLLQMAGQNIIVSDPDTLSLGAGLFVTNNGLTIISPDDGLSVGISDSLGAKTAFIQYLDDTAKYIIGVNQFGAFVIHEHQLTGRIDGLLSIVHYENSLNRYPGTGKVLSISNTNTYNVMSITDTATGLEISKFENDVYADQIITILYK